MMIELIPMTYAEAAKFVDDNHRNHPSPNGHKFSIGISDGEKVVGVCMVGRPIARFHDDGWTLEVRRVATDGVKNGCSKLYQAAWKAAKNLGYKRLITYTLPKEGGASLRASGWKCLGEAGGGTWNRKNRPRVDLMPNQIKIKWEAV